MVTIGDEAITQSDVEHEYGIELFMEGKAPAPVPDPATLRQTCERLVDQELLAREASTDSAVSDAVKESALQDLDEILKRFPNPEAFQSALQALGMTEQDLLARLTEQHQILQAIDQRLRPAATPEAAEIESYYRQTFVPDYFQKAKGPPPDLSEVHDQIQEVLVQKKINQLLPQWLDQLRARRRVRWHTF